MSEAHLYLEIAVWSQVASSIVFIGALVYLWLRFLLPALLAAQDRSNKLIAQAERHRDEAREALTTLRDEIESARRDAGLIVGRAEEYGRHEREAALAEATAAGERQMRDAEGELARARALARLRLRDAMIAAALQIARSEAPERLGAAGERRLVDAAARSLESSRG